MLVWQKQFRQAKSQACLPLELETTKRHVCEAERQPTPWTWDLWDPLLTSKRLSQRSQPHVHLPRKAARQGRTP